MDTVPKIEVKSKMGGLDSYYTDVVGGTIARFLSEAKGSYLISLFKVSPAVNPGKKTKIDYLINLFRVLPAVNPGVFLLGIWIVSPV